METYTEMPCILHETSEGMARTSLRDEMFRRRRVGCTGQMTEEAARGIAL